MGNLNTLTPDINGKYGNGYYGGEKITDITKAKEYIQRMCQFDATPGKPIAIVHVNHEEEFKQVVNNLGITPVKTIEKMV